MITSMLARYSCRGIPLTAAWSRHIGPVRYYRPTELRPPETVDHVDTTKFLNPPQYRHANWLDNDCELVQVTHRVPHDFTDRFANFCIQTVRKAFDFVTGYKKSDDMSETFKGTRYYMTLSKWLVRVIFLESIAGVPGETASYLRHLRSLRYLRRDMGWIELLLDEAFNERMHLLTFYHIGNPLKLVRFMVIASQGIFTNIFFLCYLLWPKLAHRVVGYLEEEAVYTYTHLLYQLKAGQLPDLEKAPVPEIAWKYWTTLNKHSTFEELILQIRADESKHREINHTLANLNQEADRNPFALQVDTDKPQPNDGLKVVRPTGWERKELDL